MRRLDPIRGVIGQDQVLLDPGADLWLPADDIPGYGEIRVQRIDSMLDDETEALLGEMARLSFLDFLRLWFLKRKLILVEGWYLHYLCEVVEAMVRRDRDYRRVIINIPPRFLKSEIFCVAMPAWALGVDYSNRSSTLSASYSARLAERDSRRTLEMVSSHWYRRVFPWVTLHPKKKAAEEWWVVDQKTGVDVASRYSAGTGGTLTGMGGNLLLGDDLLKPSDANSDLVRGDTNDWIGETWYSRLNDEAVGVMGIVAQRLHEEDPCGYLLNLSKTPGFDRWTHVLIPNESERRTVFQVGDFFYERKRGELLCPERLSGDRTAALKVVLGQNYDGQYQQRPSKQEGGMLRPRLLVEIDMDPAQIVKEWGLQPSAYLDYASTERELLLKNQPDETAIAVMAKDQLKRLHILEIWAEPASNDVSARQMIALDKKYGRFVRRRGEKGGLKNGWDSTLTLISTILGYWAPVEGIYLPGDKVAKARALEGALNSGVVCVPKNAPWLPKFKAQLRQFPNGPLKDMVDAVAYGAHDQQDIHQGEKPPVHARVDSARIDQAMMEGYKKRFEKAKRDALVRTGQAEPDDDDE